MTFFPTQTIGIQKRGLLKNGNFADVLVFDPTQKKRMPLMKIFDYVIGIGEIAYEKEDFDIQEAALAGRVSHKHPQP